MEWIAMGVSIVGTVLYLFPNPKLVPLSLTCFVISSLFWVIVGITISMLPLVITNAFFIVVEGIAAVKWFKKYWG